MKNDVHVKNGITIPEHELEITTSRSGGAGGQHVNKTDTRITIRWNVKTTSVLSEEQKNRVLQNLQSRLTTEGELIIHNSESRSQQQNKEMALAQLVQIVRKALHVPKKRMKTRTPHAVKEARLESKTHRGKVKKMRSKKTHEEY
jgi:ribosome-associated protein